MPLVLSHSYNQNDWNIIKGNFKVIRPDKNISNNHVADYNWSVVDNK